MYDILPAEINFSSAHRRVFRANGVSRRMRGRAHADLVDTDDGLYVVKWKQNPVHRRILINSLVGAELLRRIGIAVPQWAFIYTDGNFCRNEVQIPHVVEGLHFGLRYPASSSPISVYDFLPHSLSHRLINRVDFVRVMVFDCWVDNAHVRRSVFTTKKSKYMGQMIGNSHILGFRDGSWSLSNQPRLRLPLPLPRSAYVDDIAIASIQGMVTQIQKTAVNMLKTIPSLIPPDWLALDCGELAAIFEQLAERAIMLPGMAQILLAQLQDGSFRP